jgi:hypothetical protein
MECVAIECPENLYRKTGRYRELSSDGSNGITGMNLMRQIPIIILLPEIISDELRFCIVF